VNKNDNNGIKNDDKIKEKKNKKKKKNF